MTSLAPGDESADFILDTLEWLTILHQNTAMPRNVAAGHAVPIAHFQRSLLMVHGTDIEAMNPGGDEIMTDVPVELIPGIDCSIISQSTDCSGIGLTRFRKLPGTAARRLGVPPGSYEVAGNAIPYGARQFVGLAEFYALSPRPLERPTFKLIPYHRQTTRRHLDEDIRNAWLATCISLTLRYSWTVELSLDGGPSVQLIAGLEDARELFKLRELPEGSKRRPALRHWVAKHRRKTGDGTSFADVKKHLRGVTEFTWQGVRARILPSAFDREHGVTS